MPDLNALQAFGNTIKWRYRTWVMPRLIELPMADWDQAIKYACNVEFDLIERIGLIAGLAFVAFVLRFDPHSTAALYLPVRYLLQFLAAALLLIPVAGPIFLRRARRGLDIVILERRDLSKKGMSHDA